MSIVKDVIIETVKSMPEDITFKDAAIEILEELSERQKLISLIIPEVKISDKEKKEIHDILEEMEKGEEYRLEDVREVYK